MYYAAIEIGNKSTLSSFIEFRIRYPENFVPAELVGSLILCACNSIFGVVVFRLYLLLSCRQTIALHLLIPPVPRVIPSIVF